MTTSVYQFGSKIYQPHLKECAQNLKLEIPHEFTTIEDPIAKEDSEMEIKMDFYDNIAEIHVFKTVWAIFDVLDFNEQPFPHMKSICYNGNHGYPGSYAFESTPTWIDIWKAVDSLVVESHDLRHIFIEEIKDEGLGMFSLKTGV